MKRVHRALLERRPAGRAVVVDTPYAFQVNREQMTERLRTFFRTGFARELEAVRFARGDVDSPDAVAALRRSLARADYVFAGPGSPTYARELWTSAGIADDLAGVLERGGALCLASAATLTVGRYTAPIYEVYKAGADPYWLDGLDLLGRYGLVCAVIPHYDNAEGRDYDTSRCYLGERRLARLEAELPEDAAILGIDEHTALVLDLGDDTARVVGRGHAYWRRGDDVLVFGREATPLSAVRSGTRTLNEPSPVRPAQSDEPRHLAEAAHGGDLEALAALVRAANRAPTPALLVEAVLEARAVARASGHYDLADRLRDGLLEAGIELRDGPTGTTWLAPATARP